MERGKNKGLKERVVDVAEAFGKRVIKIKWPPRSPAVMCAVLDIVVVVG